MKDFSEIRVSEPEVLMGELHLQEKIPSSQAPSLITPALEGIIASVYLDKPEQDELFFEPYFRIPGPPIPGKTTWSIN